MESVVAASRRSIESDSEFSQSEAGRSSRQRRRPSRPSSRTAKHERLRSITIPSEVAAAKVQPVISEDDRDEQRESRESDRSDEDKTVSFPCPPIPEKNARRNLRKIPSDVSLGAIGHDSPTAVASPITPSLTTGTSVATTDDEDADFQSAYSTSPRGSYGSFENFGAATEGEDSDVATPTTIAKEYLDDFGARERASSTATAKVADGRYRVGGDSVTVFTPSSPVDIR